MMQYDVPRLADGAAVGRRAQPECFELAAARAVRRSALDAETTTTTTRGARTVTALLLLGRGGEAPDPVTRSRHQIPFTRSPADRSGRPTPTRCAARHVTSLGARRGPPRARGRQGADPRVRRRRAAHGLERQRQSNRSSAASRVA